MKKRGPVASRSSRGGRTQPRRHEQEGAMWEAATWCRPPHIGGADAHLPLQWTATARNTYYGSSSGVAGAMGHQHQGVVARARPEEGANPQGALLFPATTKIGEARQDTNNEQNTLASRTENHSILSLPPRPQTMRREDRALHAGREMNKRKVRGDVFKWTPAGPRQG